MEPEVTVSSYRIRSQYCTRTTFYRLKCDGGHTQDIHGWGSVYVEGPDQGVSKKQEGARVIGHHEGTARPAEGSSHISI